MSDVKIDSSLVKIITGQKTSIKEQPALEKADLPQFSIINSGKPDAKELETQLWQLRIDPIKPRVAEQDVTSVKISLDASESNLKYLLLWPLREIAYKICSYRDGELHIGYKSITDIFTALTSKNRHIYTGLRQGLSQNDPSYAMPAPNMLRIYLCLDPNTLPKSEYKPQEISDKADQAYYSIKPWSEIHGLKEKHYYYRDSSGKQGYYWPTEFLHELLQLKPGEITYLNGQHYYEIGAFEQCPPFNSNFSLGSYLLSFGKDEKGIYLSIYDVYNFKPDRGHYDKKGVKNLLEGIEPIALSVISKPIYIYNRYYIPEKDIKNELERRAHEKIAKDK